MDIIVQNIKELAAKREVKVAVLEREAGLAKGTLSRILSGEHKNAGIQTLQAIAKALGCSLHDLIGQRSPLPDFAHSDSLSFALDNLPLLEEAHGSVVKAISKQDLSIPFDEYQRLVKELYAHAKISNTNKVDSQFLQWLIDKRHPSK